MRPHFASHSSKSLANEATCYQLSNLLLVCVLSNEGVFY
jgi:hypothetical protein